LANRLLSSPRDPDPAYPLHLKICGTCSLGQVGEFVLPTEIFSDYPYLSSVSSSWLDHVARYAQHMKSELHLAQGDLVVEVASNDGHLLKGFQAMDLPVLGIEPAANVASLAESAGVPTDCAFFGRETAERVRKQHGTPRLVTANNVLAHVPDLDDFVSGLAVLCDDHTVVTIENPSFTELLEGRQFDTIYHEHFSYLSATSVDVLARRHGLDLVRVEHLTTHGGSLRYWLTAAHATQPHASVARAIADDHARGLSGPALWRAFSDDSRRTIDELREWLDLRRQREDVVVAYGAAAKGNTLLNAVGATDSDLVAVADGSSEKVGKFLPGSHVPIVSPSTLPEYRPSDVLLLPWNIKTELAPLVRRLLPDARSWTAIPSMQEVSA
jgi:hypothetical protein